MSNLQRMIDKLAEKQIACPTENKNFDYFKDLITEGVKLGITSNTGEAEYFLSRFREQWLDKQRTSEGLQPQQMFTAELKVMKQRGRYIVDIFYDSSMVRKSDNSWFIDIDIEPEDDSIIIYAKIEEALDKILTYNKEESLLTDRRLIITKL